MGTGTTALRRMALDLRLAILGKRKTSRGMCLMVCAPLQSLLSLKGVDTKLIEGSVDEWEHVWLHLPDGRILDPTADQFRDEAGKRLPPVYIGALPKHYQPDKEAP